jgi:hypothetical protein
MLKTGCFSEHLSLSQQSNEKENKTRIPHTTEICAGQVVQSVDIGALYRFDGVVSLKTQPTHCRSSSAFL